MGHGGHARLGADLVVEAARPADLSRAARLARDCFDEDVARYFTFDGVQNFRAFIADKALRERVERQGSLVWLARLAGEAAGMGELRPKAHVALLFVTSRARGRGVGRALFERMRAHVLSLGLGTDLTVNATPNSVGFYQRLGFHRAGADREERGLRFTPMARALS